VLVAVWALVLVGPWRKAVAEARAAEAAVKARPLEAEA
jgi:hypothetical protein